MTVRSAEAKARKQQRDRDFNATPMGRFCCQRESARKRGIGWMLTFDEWWDLWAPFWALRGRTKDGYVMSRVGDSGPYAACNVQIIPHRINTADAARRWK